MFRLDSQCTGHAFISYCRHQESSIHQKSGIVSCVVARGVDPLVEEAGAGIVVQSGVVAVRIITENKFVNNDRMN
jgi:hypothetical protein